MNCLLSEMADPQGVIRPRAELSGEELLLIINPSNKRRLLDASQGAWSPAPPSTSTIVDINEAGTRLFRIGDFGTSQALFLKAMSLLTSSSVGSASRHRVAEELIEPPKSSYMFQRMDFDEGMEIYVAPETISLQDHPLAMTATLFFNMGQVKNKVADYEGALRCFEAALEVLLPKSTLMTMQPGPMAASFQIAHPIIVPILHCLGFSAYKRSKLQEATTYYKAALQLVRNSKGPNNLGTGVTMNCLGVIYYHMGAEEAHLALSHFHDAHQILSRVLGQSASYVGTTLNNLGRVMVQKDDLATALHYYERALKIRLLRLGRDHIDYAATAFNAGQSLHQLGEYDRAIFLYEEFLRVANMKFSNNHRDIAVVLSGIAQIHQKRKDYAKAQVLHERSLSVGRAALGNKHTEVAMLLNRVGNFYFEREDYDRALRSYKEGLKIERDVLGESHPNIVVTLSNIGEIYRQKGIYDKAIKLYTRAMELQQQRHGAVSAEAAGTLNVLGLISDQSGNSSEALVRLQEALVMRRSVLGENHLDVSSTLTHLGTLFYRRHMLTIAMKLFNEALRIRRAALGEKHRDVSFVLYNIGLCHQLQGNNEEAVNFFLETLRIEVLVLGNDHKDVALTLLKLGEAYKAQGAYSKALDSLNHALRIEKSILMKEDPGSVARTLTEIGNVELLCGDVSAMMQSLTEAARILVRQGRLFNNVKVTHDLERYAAIFENCAAAA